KLAFKVIHSTTILLPTWKAILKEHGLPDKNLPHNVSTQWNSSFDMADVAIDYGVGIDAITDKVRLGLSSYVLDEHEWDLLRQVQDILKDAMLYFLRSMPNLAMVILAMDYIDSVFTTGLLNEEHLDPAICATLGLAKHTLNKYYSSTDLSKLYRIAMGKY
ncbi:hypothetical protein SCLCIDRAFT_132648, partial [Scleroderma citrinum Foug A]